MRHLELRSLAVIGLCFALLGGFTAAGCGDDGGGSTTDATDATELGGGDADTRDDSAGDSADSTTDDTADTRVEDTSAPDTSTDTAQDADPCTGRALCDAAGTICRDRNIVDCAVDTDGCLVETVTECAGATACATDDRGIAQCAPTGGDSCAAPGVITEYTLLRGEDFTTAFADDHDFSDASCPQPSVSPSPEAVYAIELQAGERITVRSTGLFKPAVGIMKSCSDTAECVGESRAYGAAASYLATVDETVYAYIALAENSPMYDYRFEFVFTECGNGVVEHPYEGGEYCDDGDLEGDDGCSATCEGEYGWSCTGEPSECTLEMLHLGTFAAGDPIDDVMGPIASGNFTDHVRIAFSEDVMLTGTLVADQAGADFNLWVNGPTAQFVTLSRNPGDETFNFALLAGTYTFVVMDGNGDYTLSLATTALAIQDLGTFAAGETIADVTGGPLTAPAFDHYRITLSETVRMSGTLTSSPNDGALLIYDTHRDVVAGTERGFERTFSDTLVPAGTYVIQVRSFADDGVNNYGDLTSTTLGLTTTAP